MRVLAGNGEIFGVKILPEGRNVLSLGQSRHFRRICWKKRLREVAFNHVEEESEMLRLMVVLSALAILALPAFALEIQIVPAGPNTSTPVEIKPTITMGDTGYEDVQTLWTQTGNTFDVSWYMKDLHGTPGMVFPQVLTPYSGLAEVGLLPEGAYTVNARLFMSFYPFYEPYYVAGTGTTSFQVVPEPASLFLLAPVVLWLRRPRRH